MTTTPELPVVGYIGPRGQMRQARWMEEDAPVCRVSDALSAIAASQNPSPVPPDLPNPMQGDESEADLSDWQLGSIKPANDGLYLRNFDEGEATTVFSQGLWRRDGFFSSDIQDAPWKGRSLAAAAQTALVPLLPEPGSLEATAVIEKLLAEYNYPANSNNAARAGFEAARRMLAAIAAAQKPAVSTTDLPIAVYHAADRDGKLINSEMCVCEDDVFTGSDEDCIGVPLVRLSDAMAAITAAQAAQLKDAAPLTHEQIINAMHEDGCERIENFYVVGPVQKAAVFSFARAIEAARNITPATGTQEAKS